MFLELSRPPYRFKTFLLEPRPSCIKGTSWTPYPDSGSRASDPHPPALNSFPNILSPPQIPVRIYFSCAFRVLFQGSHGHHTSKLGPVSPFPRFRAATLARMRVLDGLGDEASRAVRAAYFLSCACLSLHLFRDSWLGESVMTAHPEDRRLSAAVKPSPMNWVEV